MVGVRGRFWLLAALAAMAFALAGCGRSTAKPQLVLFTWTPPDELAVNQRLIAEFQSQHPELDVKLINEPSQRAMDKLQGMIVAGKAPDVMSIHGAYFVPFAAKGALLNLEPLVKQDSQFELADFYPRLLDLCRYQGKLYSLPRYASIYALFYNRDLFDQAGVAYPDESWTWDTYLQAARKLTIRSADPSQTRYGCAIDFWGSRVYPWIWGNGGQVIDLQSRSCVVDSPAAQQALQFLVDLNRKHGVAAPISQADHRETKEMFKAGRVAMFMSGAWDVQVLKTSTTLNWDVAPLPKGKVRTTLLGTENYAISAKTKNPQAAWQLMSFLLGKKNQAVMATELEKQPSRRSVAEGSYLAEKAGYNRKVFVDAVSYGQTAPNIEDWDRISRYLQDQLDLMWLGQVSVQEGTARAAARVTKALEGKL